MLGLKCFQLICLCFLFDSIRSNLTLMEKYRPLREQCQRMPNDDECIQLKTKFLHLLQKCQQIQTKDQFIVCQQVKEKFCAIFNSFCTKTTTTTKTTKKILNKKKTTNKLINNSNKLIVTTTTTTTTSVTSEKVSDDEFVQVPIDPEVLRIRGEYCVRNGKEKKCQDLLNNLKSTYSSCSKSNSTTKSPRIDCHSFQSHLCKAFPKFPPCLKKVNG